MRSLFVYVRAEMSGIAAKLQQNRARAAGIGTNAQAVKFLSQDYEALKRECLGCGRLFEDDAFEASPAALGFNELGPNSSKVRGLKWLRPKVGTVRLFNKVVNIPARNRK